MTSEIDQRIRWTAGNMKLLTAIAADFRSTLPFEGLRIGVSLHLEAKTAVLLETLRTGGADIVAAGNYGTTQDDVVEYLRAAGIDARGSRHDDLDRHLDAVRSVAAERPDILLDNGADLVALALEEGVSVLGGTEETTSGHTRLRDELGGRVTFPVVVINDSPLKSLAENKHAVGQSVYESFLRLTNLMPQGKTILVIGYGWCGRGIAHYARANGARVMVAEIDPIKRMEAFLDGFHVGVIDDLAPDADVVLTATGADAVVTPAVIDLVPPGCILANAGHFPTEIDVEGLDAMTTSEEPLGETITRHHIRGGGFVDLVARGRMMNLAGSGAKGNSIESMDLGFAMQARSLERVAQHHEELPRGPQPVPDDINRRLAEEFVTLYQG